MPDGAVINNQTRSREDVDPALDAVDGDAVDGDPVDVDLDLAEDLASVGLDLPEATLDALLGQVREHAERVALEVEQLAVLQDLGQPLVTVPFLIDGVDLDAITEIADLLADQGMVS